MKTEKKHIVFRVKLVYAFFFLLGLLVVGKLIALQIFTEEEEIELLSKQVIHESVIEPFRGDILSRNGKVLATSVPYYEVGWDPNCPGITDQLFIEKIDSLTICLSEILGKPVAYYDHILRQGRDQGTRYVRLSFNASYEQLKALKQCPIFRKGRFKGGFVYFQHSEREYPYGILARRTIGTIRKNGRKGVGLEDAFDEELRGIEGFAVKQKVAGNLWMPVNDGNEIEPQDGMDLITTIDVRIQDVAETALERRLRFHDADHGSAVVMEVETGNVLAIANLRKNKHGNYIEAFNYAVGEATDPGSTFKLASVIAALEDKVIQPDDSINTGNGVFYYYDHRMEDTHEGGFGTITFAEALIKSSNIGISKVIFNHYNSRPEQFVDRLYKMELNEPLGVCIRGEANPLIRYPGEDKWSGLSLPQMSIGYEVERTPLQILAFYNAVANDGKKLKPRFVSSLNYRGKEVKKYPTVVLNPSICSRTTLNQVRDMLKRVVEEGTAANLKNNNYTIAGKTGTAQINYGLTTKEQYYQASFVGYFPADNPKYSCIVVIHDPKRYGYYGNIVAGPVFCEIASRIHSIDPDLHPKPRIKNTQALLPDVKISDRTKLNHVLDVLDVPRDTRNMRECQWVYPVKKDGKIMYYIRDYNQKNIVPNVVGMGLSDAIKVLEEHGFKVRAKGRGMVVQQQPEAFSKSKDGQYIEILLAT
ncbi:MAG: penicillin-binding protein [Bacteroidales bacterium]